MERPLAPGRYGEDGLGGSPRPTLSERVYTGLLYLYPAAFRARYRDEMVVLFGDQLRDARSAGGGVAATWMRTLIDLATSAVAEHYRRDRTVAQSLATFEPTRSMRLLGAIGIGGAALLLVAFLSFDPFENRALNIFRLVWFGCAGAAIALAFYPRHAVASPRLAFVVTALVATIGVTYALLTAQAFAVAFLTFTSPIGVDAALWLSAAVFGASMLWMGVAWRGMTGWASSATRLGAILLLGSAVAWVGDDRFHLVDDRTYGGLFSTLAVVGVVMNGAGWLLLGAALLVGDRGKRAT